MHKITVLAIAIALAGCAQQAQIDVRAPASREHVRDLVADTAAQKLGQQWVPVALRIAKVESNFNPHAIGPRTRHGHALGVMQVLPSSARALGYAPSRLLDPQTGVEAGIAHMQACLEAGVQTDRQMALCHVAGIAGWNTRLRRRSEGYKQSYARMVSRAH